MVQLKKNRAHISVATALTFIPTMITSLFLLCHIRFPGIMTIHKWVGLAFVVSCLLHIPINWTVLRNHLNDRSTIPAMVFTGLLTLSMLLVGIATDNGGRGGHHGKGYANHLSIK